MFFEARQGKYALVWITLIILNSYKTNLEKTMQTSRNKILNCLLVEVAIFAKQLCRLCRNTSPKILQKRTINPYLFVAMPCFPKNSAS